MRRNKGFTMIELMIVMAIVGIIAAVAFPAYTKSLQKGRRADAKGALTQASQALERCYSTYGVYNSGNCPELTALTTNFQSSKGYYTISGVTTGSNAITGIAYTVTATAVSTGPQAKDTGCTVMNIDNTGRQTSGSATSTSDTGGCW